MAALFGLVRQHGGVFLTWTTFLPALLVLLLLVIQADCLTLALAFCPNHARGVDPALLALPFVLILGIAMLGWTFTASSSSIRWTSRRWSSISTRRNTGCDPGPARSSISSPSGRINPRQMVRVEVSKALVEASRLINVNLWWITVQTGLRIAYGLSLWVTWCSSNGECEMGNKRHKI